MTEASLILTAKHFDTLLHHLTSADDERMAFGYCGGLQMPDQWQALLRALDLPEGEEYRRQAGGFVSLKGERTVVRAVRARGQAAFLDAHSHPFADFPAPSRIDNRAAISQARLLHDLAPGVRLIRLVVSGTGRIWAEHTVTDQIQWRPLDRIAVLGANGRRVIRPVNAPLGLARQGSPHEKRTLAVLGSDKVLLDLRSTSVAVIGLGGVGSAVTKLLAGHVDHLILIDPDVVEVHNAPRTHFYADGDCGQAKIAVAQREILRAFPKNRVQTVLGRFPCEETVEACKGADFLFCCPDHNAVRYSAAQLAARFMKPLIEVGCGGRRSNGRIDALGYHVRLQYPGGPCLACNGMNLRGLEDPSSTEMKHRLGYLEDGGAVPGELVSLTTRAACDAVEVFFRYITGYVVPLPRHLYYDALLFRSLDATEAYRSDPDCSLCGTMNSLQAAGDQLPADQQILPSPGGEYAFV
jgi:molybdopterin/thiamine biosynthesis adenylyltransferase